MMNDLMNNERLLDVYTFHILYLTMLGFFKQYWRSFKPKYSSYGPSQSVFNILGLWYTVFKQYFAQIYFLLNVTKAKNRLESVCVCERDGLPWTYLHILWFSSFVNQLDWQTCGSWCTGFPALDINRAWSNFDSKKLDIWRDIIEIYLNNKSREH